MRDYFKKITLTMALSLVMGFAATAAAGQVSNETRFPYVEGAPAGDRDARPGERPGAFRRDRDDPCEVRVFPEATERRDEVRRCR